MPAHVIARDAVFSPDRSAMSDSSGHALSPRASQRSYSPAPSSPHSAASPLSRPDWRALEEGLLAARDFAALAQCVHAVLSPYANTPRLHHPMHAPTAERLAHALEHVCRPGTLRSFMAAPRHTQNTLLRRVALAFNHLNNDPSQGDLRSRAAERLLGQITGVIDQLDEDALRGSTLERLLSGCHRFQDSPNLRAFLGALATKIQGADALSPSHISHAVYGLKQLPASPEVCEVLHHLAAKIRHATGLFEPRGFSRALYGLQSMGSSPAQEALLGALCQHFSAGRAFTAAEIDNALYGLQHSHSSAAVQQVLHLIKAALPDRLEPPLQGLSAQSGTRIFLAETIHSLRNHLGQAPARSLLAALCARLEACPQFEQGMLQDDRWRESQIFKILSGHLPLTSMEVDLHSMSHSLAECVVRKVFRDTQHRALVFITGQSSHKVANQGRMQAVVSRAAGDHGWRVSTVSDNAGRLEVQRDLPRVATRGSPNLSPHRRAEALAERPDTPLSVASSSEGNRFALLDSSADEASSGGAVSGSRAKKRRGRNKSRFAPESVARSIQPQPAVAAPVATTATYTPVTSRGWLGGLQGYALAWWAWLRGS